MPYHLKYCCIVYPVFIIAVLCLHAWLMVTTSQHIYSWNPDWFATSGRRGNEYCPFGVHSRRRCPGYLFSYFEVGIFSSILLSSFQIVPVEGQTIVQVHGLVTEPKEDIKVYIRSRETCDKYNTS